MNPLDKIYQHPLLSEDDLNKIVSAHQRIHCNKNEFLLKEGQVADAYYVIAEGLIRAFVHDYNNNQITTEFFTDLAIQPSSLFQQIPSPENLHCVTECELWKITLEDFQRLFHSIEGLAEWGRLWFSFQLFGMKQRSLDMITLTAAERYLKLMKENPKVIQQAPLKQIASYLGITDSSLSRIRREIVQS